MNILENKNFIKKNSNVKIQSKDNTLRIINPTDQEVTLIIPKVYVAKKDNIEINFLGNVIKGEKGVLVKLVNRKGQVVNEIGLNTNFYTKKKMKFFMIALRMMPQSEVEITKFEMNYYVFISFLL